MKTTVFKTPKLMPLLVATLLSLAISACQRTDTTTNTNLANANTSPAANANLSPTPASLSAAREPEKYRATLVFSAETEGGEDDGIPRLICRGCAQRRRPPVAFKLPDGSDLIYLEKGDLHIVVAPARKQYAELTPEATGTNCKVDDRWSGRFLPRASQGCRARW